MFKSFRDPCLAFASALTHSSNFNASSARWNAVKFLLPNIAKNIIQNLAVSGGSALGPEVELIDVRCNHKVNIVDLALHFCPP